MNDRIFNRLGFAARFAMKTAPPLHVNDSAAFITVELKLDDSRFHQLPPKQKAGYSERNTTAEIQLR